MPPVAQPLQTLREDLLARLGEDREYDLAVVGGGAYRISALAFLLT